MDGYNSWKRWTECSFIVGSPEEMRINFQEVSYLIIDSGYFDGYQNFEVL